jgi:hypothetical protein
VLDPHVLAPLGIGLAAVLTLITLSYAIGDHPAFRVVLYLFIGVAAGYAGAIAVQDVILPQLVYPLFDEFVGVPSLELGELAVRVALAGLLLTKLSPRTARLGNPVTALLAGVGAALAVAGAIQGTILPQIGAASGIFDVEAFDLAMGGGYYGDSLSIVFQGILVLLTTVSTLAYFHFGAQPRGKQEPVRPILVDALAWLGSILIAVALATLFAGILLAALGALIERVAFLRDALMYFMGGG